jgi:hypothetical protein
MVRYTNFPFALAQNPGHRRLNVLSSLKATVHTRGRSKDTQRTNFKHWCVVHNIHRVAGFCNGRNWLPPYQIQSKLEEKVFRSQREGYQPDRRKG